MEQLKIHENIKKKLTSFIAKNKIPHIIFHGPSGGGKRHIVNYFIQTIYSHDIFMLKQYVMYVNCAHGKGIRFIRDELKFFAKTNIQNNRGRFFKSIILFNADQLTTDAQSALRRCIELFSHTTRFFIIVSNMNKLLNPILSRFCSIHIPLPYINGKICNLHTNKKNNFYNKYDNVRYKKLYKYLQKKDNYSSLRKSKQFALKLYENGYNALDLFYIIENKISIDKKKKFTLLLYFDRIKKQFRNEKLLMFYIIYVTFLRPDYNLEI